MAAKFKPQVMLDSGAFSAWVKSEPISLDAYIKFCKANRDLFYSVVCLDKMPGEKGRTARDTEAMELAASTSNKNYMTMRKAGIETIPVFHMGEDFKWLDLMIKQRIPYIGISRYMKASDVAIQTWLDKVFTRLTDQRGRPVVKTHGFGITSPGLVHRYPWFTVDSTSWALSAAYGNLLFPRLMPFGHDFSFPVQFHLSERDEAGPTSLLRSGPVVRQAAEKYFALFGFSFAEVRNFQDCRLSINACYYRGLESQLAAKGPCNFAYRKGGGIWANYADRVADFDYTPSIFLATFVDAQQGHALTRAKIVNRLVSYYHVQSMPVENVERYVVDGFTKEKSQDRSRRHAGLVRRATASPEEEYGL